MVKTFQGQDHVQLKNQKRSEFTIPDAAREPTNPSRIADLLLWEAYGSISFHPSTSISCAPAADAAKSSVLKPSREGPYRASQKPARSGAPGVPEWSGGSSSLTLRK